MSRAISEYDIQRALCIWLDGNPDSNGVPRTTPALVPGAVYWHTPNGGHRDAREGKRLKETGVKPGIHDLLFLHDGRLYGLELKAAGGSLSPAQRIMHPRLLAAGMAASCVADNLQDARAFLYRNMLTVSI